MQSWSFKWYDWKRAHFPDCDLCCLKWYVAPRSYCKCVRVARRVRSYRLCRRLWQMYFLNDMILVPSQSKGLPLVEKTLAWIQDETRLKTWQYRLQQGIQDSIHQHHKMTTVSCVACCCRKGLRARELDFQTSTQRAPLPVCLGCMGLPCHISCHLFFPNLRCNASVLLFSDSMHSMQCPTILTHYF